VPAGPPDVVQILRLSAGSGAIAQGGFVEEAGPVLDLGLSGRVGGVWLSYRVAGEPLLHIRDVDDDGQLGARDGWFAHATVYPGCRTQRSCPS
jgi:hypothetical protein